MDLLRKKAAAKPRGEFFSTLPASAKTDSWWEVKTRDPNWVSQFGGDNNSLEIQDY